MGSDYEKTIEYLENLLSKLHGSSERNEEVKFSHDIPSHTSIRIPSEREEFLKRKKRFTKEDEKTERKNVGFEKNII